MEARADRKHTMASCPAEHRTDNTRLLKVGAAYGPSEHLYKVYGEGGQKRGGRSEPQRC